MIKVWKGMATYVMNIAEVAVDEINSMPENKETSFWDKEIHRVVERKSNLI